jgi:phosphatidylinositol alpha-mannosyltransferase
LYVAPNTGGESFGIILAEALAAGAPVIASDLPAFRDVLEDGRAGVLFPNEDSQRLAEIIEKVLNDNERRRSLKEIGRERARDFDWSVVGESIFDVYRLVSATGEKVRLGSELRFNRVGRNP